VDGLFTQSSVGIPSKVGLWLMPPPPGFLPFSVRLPNQQALSALVELMRPLRIANVVPNNITIANTAWDRAPFEKPNAAGGTGEQGAWRAYGALYGLPDNVALYSDLLRSLVATIAGAQLSSGADIKDEAGIERVGLMRGEAGRQALRLDAWGGPACMRITFAASAEGDSAKQMDDLARSKITGAGAPYLCEFSVAGRALLQDIFLPYTPSNRAQRNGLATLAQKLIEDMGKAGFGVAGESFELRFIADRYTSSGPMGALMARVRESFQPGSQRSAAVG
jgi:4-cresol dehydrogenase (hydroxylating)